MGSNGLKPNGLDLGSMDDCEFGNNKIYQTKWMKWVANACNFYTIPFWWYGIKWQGLNEWPPINI